ncbi:MAG: TolC family protein [Cyclobacteriaceae bacterium]|nr:TolC family protein [Cyclobacteriaceae bacterium]
MRNFFLIFLTLITISLNGQDMDLTYEEAVKIALEQNVDLRMQENQMDVIRAEKAQSRGEMAPSISANLRGYRANGNTFLEQEARTINTTSDNLSASVNANLNIFSGFSQINRLKYANASYEAQRKLIERTSQDVIFEVTNQFLQVLLDIELLKIAEDNLKTQELLFKQIEAMVEAGNRPKSDQYDQLAGVKNMELLVLQGKNNLSNDKSILAITLQLDPTVQLTLTDPAWDLDEVRLTEFNLDELYEISLTNRPDLKQFQLTEVASEKAISISKADFAPSLYAFYALGTRYNDQAIRSIDAQLTTDNKNSAYGLNLSIPIYTGLRNRTQYVRQKVQFENSKINTENLRKTILTDVRQAYQNFLDVRSAYDVSLAQHEASVMALNVQKEKYSLGVGSLIELTNSNNNYVFAASKQAQAQLNLLFQKVILDYHTGILQAQ